MDSCDWSEANLQAATAVFTSFQDRMPWLKLMQRPSFFFPLLSATPYVYVNASPKRPLLRIQRGLIRGLCVLVRRC